MEVTYREEALHEAEGTVGARPVVVAAAAVMTAEMAPEEPEDEDPTVGHEGKEYTPRTTKGREMAQMFWDFCGLP